MAAQRKNIVVIMTDQQQAALSRAEGFPLDLTPYIDTLGERGVRFPFAYTSSPICTPARVSFLSGRYVSAHGYARNAPRQEHAHFVDPYVVPKDAVAAGPTLFGYLRQHGYKTAIVGKNHAHADNDDFDYARSFHHRSEFADDKSPENRALDAWLDGLNHVMSPSAAPGTIENQLPHRIVDQSIAWIDQQRDSFAIWVSIPEPHNPYQTCEPYFSMFDGDNYVPPTTSAKDLVGRGHRWSAMREKLEYALEGQDIEAHLRRSRSNYFGMLRLIDDEVKRLVEYLESKNLLDDTLIVFTSDHGDFVGEYGLIRKGVDLPECLIRIPLIFAGAGIPPQTPAPQAFTSLVDIYPTVCDYAQLPLPRGLQGFSLKPLLEGQPCPAGAFDSAYAEYGDGTPLMDENDFERLKPKMFFKPFLEGGPYWSSGSFRSLRQGDWKIVVNDRGPIALYNLETDPWELTNRIDDAGTRDIQLHLLRCLVDKLIDLQTTQHA